MLVKAKNDKKDIKVCTLFFYLIYQYHQLKYSVDISWNICGGFYYVCTDYKNDMC